MAFIGNTPQNQGFTPAIDYFSGNGVTVTFTLSRPVVSVAQMIVAIDNVIQNPSSAFTVSGNSITFTSAPLSGTNNIWVEYTSLITQYNAISQDPSVIGDITASGGYLATGDFGNTFTDGTIVDYVTGMARITTGSAAGMTFYNGGPSARNPLLALTSTGQVAVNSSGSASAPVISKSDDLNTGIFFPAADTIAFSEGGTEVARFDSSGNLGIGTSSPVSKLQVSGGPYPQLTIDDAATRTYGIGVTGAALTFFDRSASAERMRIDSSGNLLVGTTVATSGASRLAVLQPSNVGIGVEAYASGASFASNIYIAYAARNTTNGSFNAFTYYNIGANTTRFVVTDAGSCFNSTGSYGAFSDIKLKENIADATPKLDKLNKVRVVNYNLKNDTTKQIGVIAQELEQLFPSMVEESRDKDIDGNDLGTTTKSVKYSVFVPMLIKAIQELKAIVDQQSTELDSVKAELATLKGAA